MATGKSSFGTQIVCTHLGHYPFSWTAFTSWVQFLISQNTQVWGRELTVYLKALIFLLEKIRIISFLETILPSECNTLSHKIKVWGGAMGQWQFKLKGFILLLRKIRIMHGVTFIQRLSYPWVVCLRHTNQNSAKLGKKKKRLKTFLFKKKIENKRKKKALFSF